MSVQALLHAYNENGLTLYSKIHIKYDIKRFYVCDDMRKGYERMAEINLYLSEIGLFDALSTLSYFEALLNGDDN
jgi:hypothetical protein